MHTEYIRAQQLHIAINSQIILNQVDLAVTKGESVAIIGSNGSGKTTLLRAICGLISPSKGSLSIAGFDHQAFQQNPKLRHLIGFAPDTPPLYHHDTPESYLTFIAQLKGLVKPIVASRVTTCLELFDLTQVRQQAIYSLSKGTQQRLNLAQAVLHDPEIIVLDEPTNGLDQEQTARFAKVLATLKSQNKTLIIASHLYSDLLPICDYICKINDGHLIKEITQSHDQFNYST